MSTIHLPQTTTSTPEQFVAGLTDFGPGRSRLVPDRVVMTTTDSNVWGGNSGHTYTFTRQPDGTTGVDAVVEREGKHLKGRFLGFVLGTVGKRASAKALGTTVKAIEARNVGAAAAEPA